MRRFFLSQFMQRLYFSAVVAGLVLSLFAGLRYFDLHNQLSGNMAAQIHESGGEVDLESKAQAQRLMAADIQRRRALGAQREAMVLGGVGLALLGLGWLGLDAARGRRRADANPNDASPPS